MGVDGTVGQPPHRFGSRWKLWLLMSLLVILSIEGLLQLAALSNKRVNEILTGVPRTLPDPVLRVRPNPALPDHDAAGWRNAERLARETIGGGFFDVSVISRNINIRAGNAAFLIHF